MAFSPKLTYKNRPLVRCGNEVYYGSMADPFVIFMQIVSTKKEGNVEIADKVQIVLLSTDTSKPLPERMKKNGSRNGLYSALDIGNVWLERALAEKPKAK